MMRRDEIRKNLLKQSQSYWWIFAGLIVAYLISRLLWLNRFPPFIDELLHIGSAIMFRLGNLGAGFSEGKWLTTTMIATFSSFPGEDLWEARLVSVMSGLISTVGLFLIGKALFTIRIGLLATLFYVIIPYALFYDRLALADGIVVTFGIWIVFVTIKLLGSENGMLSVLLATLLMLSFLTKAPAMIFITIPPLAIIILIPFGQWLRATKKILPAMIGSAIVLLVLLLRGYGSENFRGKYEINIGKSLLLSLYSNGSMVLDWGWRMLTPPLAVLSLLAVGWSLIVDRSRSKLFLISLLIITIGPYLLIAKTFYPRYLLFALVPITLLLSCFASWLIDGLLTLTDDRPRYKVFALALLVLLLAWPLFLDYQILMSPERATLPALIRWQYIEGWPSGYGVRQLAEYLSTEAKEMENEQLYVVRPFMGGQVYGSGLDLYLQKSENILLEVIGPDPEISLASLAGWLGQGHRVVIVADTTNPTGMAVIEQVSPYLKAEQIWFYPKPASDRGFVVWEVEQGVIEVP